MLVNPDLFPAVPSVLLASEDAALRQHMRETLSASGFEVLECADWRKAEEAFVARQPDVVVLDIDMSGPAGLEVCRRMVMGQADRQIPVILTGDISENEKCRQAFESGATDFILKPINWNFFALRLRYLHRCALTFNQMRVGKLSMAIAQRLARLGAWNWNPDTDHMHCSEELCEVLEIKDWPRSASCEHFLALVHPDDRETVTRVLHQIRASAQVFAIEHRVILRDGSIRHVMNRAEILKSESGSARRVVGMIQDITEREHARRREEKLGGIINASGSEFAVFAADTLRILEANATLLRNLGYTPEELQEKTPAELMQDFTRELLEELVKPLRTDEQNQVLFNCFFRRKNGSVYPVELCIQLCEDESRPVFFAIAQDFSDRKKINEQIRHLAYYDSLTALPNRHLFQLFLDQELKKSQRYERKAAVLLVDLDRFKRINQSLGHRIGDVLLKELSVRLGNCVRTSDGIAREGSEGPSGMISRFGGDKFLIMLPELRYTEDAAIVAQRILKALSSPIYIEEHELIISASIGIAVCPDDGYEAEMLIMLAETAMNQAKSEDTSNYLFYKDSMNQRSRKRLDLEMDLRKAIEQNQFLLHYQPQVALSSGQIVGAEALIRWRHPERGMVSPLHFIPLAEETGLIVDIGAWVFAAACAQKKVWNSLGYPHLRISVNLSPRQLRGCNLPGSITSTLNAGTIAPSSMVLELTESSLMHKADENVRLLGELKQSGIGLSVDDFGTGYSSLSYLKQFPLDTLKIDRSFVKDITSDVNSNAIVSAIIAMARSMKLKTIAEGVETNEQLTYLWRLGCDEIQGFLFSKPVPADDFSSMLARNYNLSELWRPETESKKH